MTKSLRDLYYDPFEEEGEFAFETLDDALSMIAECAAEERGGQWRMGAVVAAAVDVFGKYGTYKKLAEVCAYTPRRLQTFEKVHRTFGPELRLPDQPLLLYETALKADDPADALTWALDEGWSPRQLRDALSKEKGEKVSEVSLFSGEAPLIAQGDIWRIAVEAGRDWPDGDGAHTCHVTVKQILKAESASEEDPVGDVLRTFQVLPRKEDVR